MNPPMIFGSTIQRWKSIFPSIWSWTKAHLDSGTVFFKNGWLNYKMTAWMYSLICILLTLYSKEYSVRRMQICWSRLREGPDRCSEHWSTSPIRKGCGKWVVQLGKEEALGRPYCSLPVLEGRLQAGEGLAFHLGRQWQDREEWLKEEKFVRCLEKNIYSKGGEALRQTAQRVYGCPIPGGAQDLQVGWGPTEPLLEGGNQPVEGGLELNGLKCSFQPKSFSDSLICFFVMCCYHISW